MISSAFYSDSYASARERFRKMSSEFCTQITRAKTSSFQVPSLTDQDLSVDYLIIPPQHTKKNLIVVMSGVHGIEGYTGSAIQLMLLDKFASQLDSEDCGFLIAHSMNPFGFKYVRRSTEGNVNLNRNFAPSAEMFKTPNPSYHKFASMLAPASPVIDPWLGSTAAAVRVLARKFLGEMTTPQLIQGIAQGQFEFPEGLEYGGMQMEPQIADFAKRLKSELQDYENLICFDLHTGLGERYQMHLIPGNASRPQDLQLSSRLFRLDEIGEFGIWTPTTSEGFYQTVGDSNDFVMSLVAGKQSAVAITVEYGTLGNGSLDKLRTLGRLIVENQGYNFGYFSKVAEARAKRAIEDLFAPAESRWRANSIERAQKLFGAFFQRLSAPIGTVSDVSGID